MDDVYLILVLVKLEILFNFISICLHFRSHPVDSIHLKIEWIDHEPKWKPKGMLHIIWEFIMLKLPSMNVMFSQVYTRFHLFENRKKKRKKKNSINLCKKIETSIATIDVFWTNKKK